MDETRNLWIEAAKILSTNPNTIVSCPICKEGKLKVKDVPIETWNKINLYLYCDICGKYNILTMNNPNK